MTKLASAAQAMLIGLGLVLAQAARADDSVEVGLVGAISPTHWPVLVGLKKGYYAAERLKLDLIHAQSSGAVLQQLAAGSIDATISAAVNAAGALLRSKRLPTSQTSAVVSMLPEISRSPSAENAKDSTQPRCPANRRRSRPLAVSMR